MKPQTCYAVPYNNSHNKEISNCFTEDGAGSMRGGRILFSRESSYAADADWLFVGDGIYDSFDTTVPRERRILFLMEPIAIRRYPLEYIEQFGTIVSHYQPEGYSGRWIEGNPCLGWFAGVSYGSGEAGPASSSNNGTSQLFRRLSDVQSYSALEKTKSVSMVTSLKKRRPGHAKRYEFLNALRTQFGDRIDYYGREFRPIEDKLDAIAPYKYHIAIENCRERGYWTEKLADAWIGWSLPLYCGDPSILEQVPDVGGIEIIDIYDHRQAMAKIEQILKDDPYGERIDAIKKCREWAIAESSPYERVCRIIESADESVHDIPPLAVAERIRTIPRGGIKGTIYKKVSQLLGR